jgi:hypothetical protein
MTTEPVLVPVDGLGTYVTLEAAAHAIGRSYFWTRRLLIRQRVPLLDLKGTYLVRLSDVRAAMRAA